MDEFELIEAYFAGRGGGSGVVVGIGDDGAVLAPEPGLELVTVIDTLVAGTHFPRALDPGDIAYRAVAVNLSDIAAMGARPRWMTLALTLPAAEPDWLQAFAAGLHAAAGEHDVALVGGDTTAGDGLVVTVQITGDVEPGRALCRSGANVGETIFVTGTVGDAAAGLELITAGETDPVLSARFCRPSARVAYGRRLAGRASAAIDVSDGLYADLGKLLKASQVGGEISIEQLPMSAALQARFAPQRQQQFALSGGDDYELCFTARPEDLPAAGDLPVTAIGTVTAGTQLDCLLHGRPVAYRDRGYRHFAQ